MWALSIWMCLTHLENLRWFWIFTVCIRICMIVTTIQWMSWYCENIILISILGVCFIKTYCFKIVIWNVCSEMTTKHLFIVSLCMCVRALVFFFFCISFSYGLIVYMKCVCGSICNIVDTFSKHRFADHSNSGKIAS